MNGRQSGNFSKDLQSFHADFYGKCWMNGMRAEDNERFKILRRDDGR